MRGFVTSSSVLDRVRRRWRSPARIEVNCNFTFVSTSEVPRSLRLDGALATKLPVVVVMTSGTAAAESHAAVCEADAANVPLIVVTADRPPELHGVGAPQTINQRELYGGAVRLFEEPGVAHAYASNIGAVLRVGSGSSHEEISRCPGPFRREHCLRRTLDGPGVRIATIER